MDEWQLARRAPHVRRKGPISWYRNAVQSLLSQRARQLILMVKISAAFPSPRRHQGLSLYKNWIFASLFDQRQGRGARGADMMTTSSRPERLALPGRTLFRQAAQTRLIISGVTSAYSVFALQDYLHACRLRIAPLHGLNDKRRRNGRIPVLWRITAASHQIMESSFIMSGARDISRWQSPYRYHLIRRHDMLV